MHFFLQAVADRWAATASFKHARANQIATRLPGHCSGPARCCSQPASQPTGRPTAYAYGSLRSPHQKSIGLYLHAFWKNVIVLVTTTPINTKRFSNYRLLHPINLYVRFSTFRPYSLSIWSVKTVISSKQLLNDWAWWICWRHLASNFDSSALLRPCVYCLQQECLS